MVAGVHYCNCPTIDVAEATGLALLCMMQSTSPIDCDIALPSVQTRRAFHCAASADTAELEQPVEDWAIVSDVVLALLLREIVHVVGGDFVKEVDVLVGVKLRHFVLGGWFGALGLSDFECLQGQ